MDARRSTSPLIRRAAVPQLAVDEVVLEQVEADAVVPLPRHLEPVGAQLLLWLRVRARQAPVLVDAVRVEVAVDEVKAAPVDLAVAMSPRSLQTEDLPFPAWRSSMPCSRPASIRMRSSARVGPKLAPAVVLAILFSAPESRPCFARR